MRCCVPFCKNTSDNVTTSEGISFHGFPSEGSLRAAWLSALGKQDSQLPHPALVCSQHFLTDDISETESGFRQLVAGAVPSTVQVCMICLDTDSKLLLMSKHRLGEAYEQLTGHPPCDPGNLKQTLCVQCAQRLINFSRFRDKSLRSRTLLMGLIDKHELITRRHISMIDRTKNQLKSNIVWTTLGPDPCNLYILEQCSEDEQTEPQETEHRVLVKKEASDDFMLVDGDTEVIIHKDDSNSDNAYDGLVASNEECLSDTSIKLETQLLDEALKWKAAAAEQVVETQDPLKCESAPFQCTFCFAEFLYEHTHMQHMCEHLQSGAGDGACAESQVGRPRAAGRSACDPSLSSQDTADLLSIHKQSNEPHSSADLAPTVVAPLPARPATSNANKAHATDQADTIEESKPVAETSNGEIPVHSYTTNTNIDTLTNCVVQLYDCTKFKDDQATSHNVVPAREKIKPVTNEERVYKCNVSKSFQYESDSSNNSIDLQINNATGNKFLEKKSFTCDVCQNTFKVQSRLVKHMKTHNEAKYERKSVTHIRSHTGKKPYTCKVCQYQFMYKSDLVRHMQTHTGEKPFSCSLCEYKTTHRGSLVTHMRTHTGEKPYACQLCSYTAVRKYHVVQHMRTHTGEKPYSCKSCNFKCSTISSLTLHTRTHTGEKPYSCKFCNYRSSSSSGLLVHSRIHTGEKPFACKLCNYKSSTQGSLVNHMMSHTGEKPYSCNFCNFKCSSIGSLTLHTRTHTGEKPYSCKFCSYRSSSNKGLLVHSRIHMGEKPLASSYKCTKKKSLGKHMRSHSGEGACSSNKL